ncbi:ROK family protein [Clostridium algidicarnis]|uniref:Glucokinase n=2 Tax=Clostridium algidicarnis TaxID=37659 RepID=A0A2S6FUF4_9CLOT|nr:ROK family protein [Clostridium algidicarnis]MBB6632462.1 ROK family protein [Clostridium algidicarnis]MBB6698723.1 ROK family protein [Clostridium algidicarnis]MBU3194951.1 ROK family protein [Clostridium algidicarnis]MBU3197639.1 ROK family protein [Clostridium algidicarnis]MBU3207944.1 ROK family protein [Clostridium algidicarnis]
MKEYFIGIDLGGTKIAGVITDLKGNIIKENIIKTMAEYGDKAIVLRIINLIEDLIISSGKTLEDIRAVGIGSPGPLDPKRGIIITTPNLPFENFDIITPIKEKFNVPVFLDNDANVAAIGEYTLGAGKNTKNMVYITVSTGIGGGAIINGKIYRGNTFNALEIGHMTLLPDGPKCNCGNYGCFEALASGTAISKRAEEAVESGRDTSLLNYFKITSYEVFKEAEKGDSVSRHIIDSSLEYLGIGIANIITLFDPEVIILGGGVMKAGQIIFDRIKEVVDQRCFKNMASACKIVPSALGEKSGVIGAIALAMMETE